MRRWSCFFVRFVVCFLVLFAGCTGVGQLTGCSHKKKIPSVLGERESAGLKNTAGRNADLEEDIFFSQRPDFEVMIPVPVVDATEQTTALPATALPTAALPTAAVSATAVPDRPDIPEMSGTSGTSGKADPVRSSAQHRPDSADFVNVLVSSAQVELVVRPGIDFSSAKSFSLVSPPRIVVDLTADTRPALPAATDIGNPYAQRLRTGWHAQKRVLRLVVDTTASSLKNYTVFEQQGKIHIRIQKK